MVNACKLYSEFSIFIVCRIFLTALGKAVQIVLLIQKHKHFKTLCMIWYHLHNLKYLKNTNIGLLLSSFRTNHGCFHVFQIVQMVPNRAKPLVLSIE